MEPYVQGEHSMSIGTRRTLLKHIVVQNYINYVQIYKSRLCIEILGTRLGKKSIAYKHNKQATFGLKEGNKPATKILVRRPRPLQPAWILPNKATVKTHSTKSTSTSTTYRQNTVTNSLIPTVFKWIQTPICRYSKQLQSAI